MSIPWIPEDAPPDCFPPIRAALPSPNGLLAAGGDLSAERLLNAYARGIFPWFSDGEPILWWSPDPRAVFRPDRLRIPRSLRQSMRNRGYEVTMDRAFLKVVRACAEPRPDQAGTWITEKMVDAYLAVHQDGHAHSVEVWHDGTLVGGLYGISIGGAFFGESMFARMTDASKVAFARLGLQLQAWGFSLIDGQIPSRHLDALGAETWPREQFLQALSTAVRQPGRVGVWQFDEAA